MYKMNEYKNGPKYIKITGLDVTNGTVAVKIQCSENIKKYFLTNYFYVEYEQDVTNVDKSILYIPIVSSIITVAWAVGADIYIKELDKTYLNSLSKIKLVFEKWYPQFSFSTNIYAENFVSNQFNGERYGLLFSGGVDSLTSFIRHRDKHPDLFTIWGAADIPVNETIFWEKVRNRINLFSNREGVNVHFIKTNMMQLLNHSLLAREYKLKGWWGPVYHGLMLLSLCAPLTTKRIGTILIAATHTGDFKKPWGSDPLIDNNVSWADVRCVHDGYELSRQEKIRYIIKHPKYLPYLRVCYPQHSNYNCGRCEKCLQAITSLTLEGIDPKNCNFNIDVDEKMFQYIKDCLVKGKLYMGDSEIFMWRDIQKHIPEQYNNDMPGSKEFFMWFKGFDLSKYQMNKLRHLLWTISYIIAEKEVMETIKKAPSFIVRRLRLR